MSAPSLFPQHIIARKRDGHRLTRAEIDAFVRGAVDQSWADYQLSALLMAIFLRGMTPEETAELTDAMMRSGTVADLSDIPGIKVDKHSTGGVGDKVSLLLAPLVAACGVPVPMISGRGLGHSGGTLDKLEAIPGFRTDLSLARYHDLVRDLGCALIGQTRDLAPADRVLYSLRDVTATVECIPLICSSILSKKLAEGIDALVLDVKFGRGAFMKTRDDARRLAEAIAGLRGQGPADLMEVTLRLGEHMLVLGGVADDLTVARTKLEAAIADGSALARFRAIVAAQGGDPGTVDDPSRLPQARFQEALSAPRAGVVVDVDAMKVALGALRLGAGRARASDAVDPAVGISALVQRGERVRAGDALCIVHANDAIALRDAKERLLAAITLGDTAPVLQPLVADVLVA